MQRLRKNEIFNPENIYEIDEEYREPDINLTDSGNAERLIREYGKKILFCHKWKKWLIWNGKVWEIDEHEKIYRYADEVTKKMYEEASELDNAEERKRLANHAIRSESWIKIVNMVRSAQHKYGIPISPDYLDKDPFLLEVNNGTIDLSSGTLQEHNPDNFNTKISPVNFDINAECPTWLTFLDEIMSRGDEMIKFLQKAIGYAITGDTRERVFFILFGRGANGKSTFLRTITSLLGNMQYAMSTPTSTLMTKYGSEIPNDIARLKGTRFVTSFEGEEGKRLDEGLIKRMTGNDILTARFMRGEWFDFYPTFKIFFATNHKPIIRGTDKAIWDRIKLIPFEMIIPEGKQDKELLHKLELELSGVLNWAVEGCSLWQLEGLGDPAKIKDATQIYKNEMDNIKPFLEENCLVQSMIKAKSSQLYEVYKKWCEKEGEKPLTQKAFSMRLQEKGFEKKRYGSGNFWEGIGIKDDT